MYDYEHEGNPVKVDKILKRTYDGETPDEIFGTHYRTDQLSEDLMSGAAYIVPDPSARERIRDEEEAKKFHEELKKMGLK